VRGWAVGTGTVALTFALAVGATWWVTRVDDIRVVDDAQATTPTTSALSQDPPTTGQDPATPGTTGTSATTTPEVPECQVAEGRAQGDPAEDWATIVVDTAQGLPADYTPPDLVDTEEAGFDTGDKVRSIVIDDLDALRRAAIRHRTPIDLVSGYRSYPRQAELFAAEAADVGEDEARRTTARPGHSEHQLGTAVDVLALGNGDLTPDFGETPTGRWLSDNSWRHGFVISYPKDAAERSCYSYEPWHLRYVGHDMAERIHESGLTAREYLLTHPS
jgi:D-alanyl-D-alanine carboxypeptidase